MNISQEDFNALYRRAKELQEEKNSFIDTIFYTAKKDGIKLNYEDMQTIFFLFKIAELEKEIELLKLQNRLA